MELASTKLASQGIKEMEDNFQNEELKASTKPARMGRFVIVCTVIACVSSTLLGYDIGVMSGAILFVKEDLKLSTIQEELIIGSLNIVSVVGGAAAGRLSDAIGRRLTMAAASAIFLSGAVVMALSPSFAVLMVGRVLTGVGVGFALMIAPVYSAELAPARVRGSLVSLTEIFINFGILLGYVVNFALQGLPTHISWRLMLGLGALPAVALACGVLILPESPRWLVTQRRLADAKHVLIKTSDGDKEEATLRLQEIMETAGYPNLDPSADISADELAQGLSTAKHQAARAWQELLRPVPSIRRMLIVALGVHMFQQAIGIDSIVYYSPVVFTDAGIKSKLGKLGATVGVGFTKFIFIFIATVYLDQAGRRPLLLISSAGVTTCLVAVAVAFIALGLNSTKGSNLVSVSVGHASTHTSTAGASITIFGICAYVAFFSIGFGPIVWVLLSEIFPLRLRAQAVGLGVVVNRLVSGTVALTFLSISNAITPAGTFFLYGAIAALSFVFIYFLVPETKGKTLEELATYFDSHGAQTETNV